MKFAPKEVQYILLSGLLLGFCFSFRWQGSFSVTNWFNAFISSIIIICSALIIKMYVQKYVANSIECDVEYSLWSSGLVLGLLTTLGTLGYFIWAAPGAIKIKERHKFRLGKGKRKSHPGPYEFSLVAISGIVVFFAFAFFGKLLMGLGNSIFADKMIYIGSYMAIFSLLPFVYPHNTVPPVIAKGNLPTLDGVWVFFGSKSLWSFSFSFVLISTLSFMFLDLLPSILLAAAGSILMFLLWHYYFEPWSYSPPHRIRTFKREKKPFEMGEWNK